LQPQHRKTHEKEDDEQNPACIAVVLANGYPKRLKINTAEQATHTLKMAHEKQCS